jgi:hypothetical protein
MVSAASFSASKMPSMLSGMVPMTKQLNSVTSRPVPAPAGCGLRAGSGNPRAPRRIALPGRGVGLDRRQRAGDAGPGVLDRGVARRAVGGLEAVFHVPDLRGDRGGKAGHARGLPEARAREEALPPALAAALADIGLR